MVTGPAHPDILCNPPSLPTMIEHYRLANQTTRNRIAEPFLVQPGIGVKEKGVGDSIQGSSDVLRR